MGIVYRAEREHPYRQEVAIKLVRRSLLGRDARRRLQAERQVLARLDHANIARLYDGGTTEDGIPYLVMERVDGLAIDRYCDQHRLDVRARLELIQQVLAAVGHAHHHLRVHCDIKPSNILVTSDGRVKLLDFGIAKLLNPEERIATTDVTWLTKTGQRPLTPAFASPEQVRGETITTASDLYSVGVLLYELLSGCLPYELADVPDSEIEWAIVGRDPVPPSRCLGGGREPRRRRLDEAPMTPQTVAERRSVTPGELRKQLRGDLDAIVLKAIREDRSQRYSSAEAFADDIQRHLEARPVGARKGKARYRIGRFFRRLVLPPDPRRRRERWTWAAVVLIALVLAPVAVWLQRSSPPCRDSIDRLGEAWDLADRQRVKQGFLATGLPFAADTFRRVSAALDAHAAKWVATDTEICRATLVSGERSERLLDLGRLCLDGRRDQLDALVGMFSEADGELLTDAIKAVGQLDELASCSDQAELATHRLPPPEPALRQALGQVRSVTELQLLRLELKMPVDAEALDRAAIEVRELGDPALLAKVLYTRGLDLAWAGEAEKSGMILEEAARTAIVAGDRPLQTRIYGALVKVFARQAGDIERARFWEGFALASLESLGPGYPGIEYSVYDALGVLAWVAEPDQAMSWYRRALDSAERQGHPINQAKALTNLGMSDADSALRALEILDRELGPDHPNVAGPLMNLASHRAVQGRYDEALPLVQRAHRLLSAAVGEDHSQVGYSLTLIGQILVALDRPEDALRPLQDALASLKTRPGAKSQIIRDLHVSLAEDYLLLDRLPEAEVHLASARSGFGAGVSPGHPSRLNFLRVQGDYYRQFGQIDEALARHEELLSLLGPIDAGERVWPLAAAAKTLLAAGRQPEARPLLEEAWRTVSDGDRRLGSEIAIDLASTLRDRNPEGTDALLEEARKRLTDTVPLHRELLAKMAAMRGK
jgi:serine/threonine-protein kinase